MKRKQKYLLIMLMFIMGTANAEFTFVATHYEANNIYTGENTDGIKEMTAFNNKIYMGYGSSQEAANCPDEDIYSGVFCEMKVRYLDPVTGSTHLEQTEIRSQGIHTLDVRSGSLFILSEDPDSSADFIKCTDSFCSDNAYLSGGDSAHNYVSAEYQGAIYMGGQAGINDYTGDGIADSYDGVIWKSTDNGSTWDAIKFIYKDNDIECCVRVAFMAAYKGSLYVQAYQYDAMRDKLCANGETSCNWQGQSKLYKLTGNTWTSSSTPILSTSNSEHVRSKLFNNKIVYSRGVRSSKLRVFDGEKSTKVYPRNILDYAISADYIYILEESGKVLRSKNLQSWQVVEKHNKNARQLIVHNNALYIGDKNGHIWVSDKTFSVPNLAYLQVVYDLLLN